MTIIDILPGYKIAVLVALPLVLCCMILNLQYRVYDSRIEGLDKDNTRLTRRTTKVDDINRGLHTTIDTQTAILEALLSDGTGKLVKLDGDWIITAYEKSPRSTGKYSDGYTATMIPVGLGIAAADIRLLPYGTILYLETLERYFIIMDCGGAIKGRRLDLYTNSVEEALELGRFRSNVYIVRRS